MTPKILSCYYSFHHQNPLTPEMIDGSIMTHLIVGWPAIDAEGRITPSLETIEGFQRCVQLKLKYPHLKVMTVLGGQYSAVANDERMTENFVSAAVDMMEKYELDGMDVDWEFPVWNSQPYDKANFVELLRKLKSAFGSRFILTAAVAAPKLIIDPAYDIPGMAESVDFVNLMCYDFNLFKYYNVWAGHNSPLFGRPEQKSLFGTMNTAWAAEYWLSKGMPREKIVVGIPTYARTWNLLSSCMHAYHAPCTGGGSLSYAEVMDFITNGGGVRVFDRHAMVPYAYHNRTWVSFEDEESITTKAQWIKKENFGGAMIFSVDFDDFNGIFSRTGRKFPLISIVADTILTDKLQADRGQTLII